MKEYIEYLEEELRKLEEFKSSFKSQFLDNLNKWDSNRLSFANGKIEIYKSVIKSLKGCDIEAIEPKKDKKKETVYMLEHLQKPNSVLTSYDTSCSIFNTTEPEICKLVYGDRASAERALQNLPEYMLTKFQVVKVVIKYKTEKVYKIKR